MKLLQRLAVPTVAVFTAWPASSPCRSTRRVVPRIPTLALHLSLRGFTTPDLARLDVTPTPAATEPKPMPSSTSDAGGARRGCGAAAGSLKKKQCKCSPSMRKGNYFAFFGLPVMPVVNTMALQRCYHRLQGQFHPDQRLQQQQERDSEAAAAAEEENAGAEDTEAEQHAVAQLQREIQNSDACMDAISTYANEGYAVLKDPFLRCRYLGKLQCALEAKQGAVVAAELPGALTVEEQEHLNMDSDSVIKDSSIAALDEEFLMEMMAMNELIFAGDRRQEMVRNQMVVLKADLKERYEEHFEEAQRSWANSDWPAFRECLHKWTYIWNAQKNLINRL